MDFSIIIVSYNAANFLRLCLQSVQAASIGVEVEVIIVDNNSPDDSVRMVKEEFSNYTIIANKDNPGFSVANNQGIKIASGKYVLLLNPDTVLAEDTLLKLKQFMESHPDAGGAGVRMLDGAGSFLPESKRGLPMIWVSICKLSGLSGLFPESGFFNEYYKGYLPESETNKVEVLSGAFLLVRKSVIDDIGGLDERFFMYGEDIDFSYRIILSGLHNYYVADSAIIHFKGESTVRNSEYINRFYKAMVLFAKKYFRKGISRIFILFIIAGVGFAKFIFRIHNLIPKKTAPTKNESQKLLILESYEGIMPWIKGGELIKEEALDDVKGGVLILPVLQMSFKQMILLMDKYKGKFKYRFFDKTHRILLGSDLKDDKGMIYKV